MICQSWGDASERCYKRCLSGHHQECPGEEECFAYSACSGVKEDESAPKEEEEEEDLPTLAPDATASPTSAPIITVDPTMSPIAKDDMRNFFFCGNSWADASTRCYKRCPSGYHTDCPGDEECYAQAECKKGVLVPKTSRPTASPTMAPFSGTRSPTLSPAPTDFPTEPQPTMSPVPPPTSSPNLTPTEGPTTPFPTDKPTYAPCAGEPCPNKEYCRSNQGYCGPGTHCKDALKPIFYAQIATSLLSLTVLCRLQ